MNSYTVTVEYTVQADSAEEAVRKVAKYQYIRLENEILARMGQTPEIKVADVSVEETSTRL